MNASTASLTTFDSSRSSAARRRSSRVSSGSWSVVLTRWYVTALRVILPGNDTRRGGEEPKDQRAKGPTHGPSRTQRTKYVSDLPSTPT